MTFLITGGTGNTGSKLAQLLHDASYSVLIASRSPENAPKHLKSVRFDWLDPTTHNNPFTTVNVDRMYVIGPAVEDSLSFMKPFLDLAVVKGVKRFVLLIDVCNLAVPEYVKTLGVEYSVMSATWFQQNFSDYLRWTIEADDSFSTATGDGRIPFVNSDDIAQVAFEALTDGRIKNVEPFIVGPELLTYTQAAEVLSDVVGRKIIHKNITEDEDRATLESVGVPKSLAATLATYATYASEGSEEKRCKGGGTIACKRRLCDYFEEKKELWLKSPAKPYLPSGLQSNS